MKSVLAVLATVLMAGTFIAASTPTFATSAPPYSNPAVELATTSTLTPVADAYVNSAYPSTNYGTSTALRVDGSPTVRSYLRFNVAGLTGAVTNASLRLYANSSLSTGITANRVADNTWGELTLTHDNRPPMDDLVLASAVKNRR